MGCGHSEVKLLYDAEALVTYEECVICGDKTVLRDHKTIWEKAVRTEAKEK